jgi:hypothetical protein
MGNHIASIHVRRSRGKLIVQTLGQAPRGQKFLKAQEALTVAHSGDKGFKTELAQAVAKLDPT